jgi:hypothetical protein
MKMVKRIFSNSLFAAPAEEIVFALQIRNWYYAGGIFFASNYRNIWRKSRASPVPTAEVHAVDDILDFWIAFP